MFEDMTPEKIRGRILGRLKTDLQTREGSFTNDLIAAAAEEISEAYHSLDALIPAFYVDETSGPYIDKQAGTVGIVRKAGTKARCGVTFTGADGAAIPAGAVYYTASGLAFYLEAPVTLRDGTGEGMLLAAEPGDAYNIAAGEIVTALRNYSGVSGFANRAADGGADPETDGALLGRYLERMRKPATSGNPWHYQRWAKEVEGVGAARIVSKWNGPGTVKVIVADQDLQPATAAAVSACAAHIEEPGQGGLPLGPLPHQGPGPGHGLPAAPGDPGALAGGGVLCPSWTHLALPYGGQRLQPLGAAGALGGPGGGRTRGGGGVKKFLS